MVDFPLQSHLAEATGHMVSGLELSMFTALLSFLPLSSEPVAATPPPGRLLDLFMLWLCSLEKHPPVYKPNLCVIPSEKTGRTRVFPSGSFRDSNRIRQAIYFPVHIPEKPCVPASDFQGQEENSEAVLNHMHWGDMYVCLCACTCVHISSL